MTKILGITGYKGHGKDSLAHMVREQDSTWHLTHFAAPLKEMSMRVFNLSKEQVFDDKGKEELFLEPIFLDDYLSEMCKETGLNILPRGMTAHCPRHVLQYFGTDYVRSVSSNYWIDLLDRLISVYDKVIISDLRFLNEEKYLRSRDSFIIRVRRVDLPRPTDPHQSEVEIASLRPDLELGTVTGRFALQYKVANLLSCLQFDSVQCYDYRSYEYLSDYYTSS